MPDPSGGGFLLAWRGLFWRWFWPSWYPLYTKRVIDRLQDPGLSPEVAYGFLNIVAVALLAFGLIRSISIFIQILSQRRPPRRWPTHYAMIFMISCKGSPLPFTSTAATGELMSRLTSDVEMCREATGFGFSSLLGNLVWLVGIAGYLFYLDWRYTLISLSMLPFLFLVATRYTQKVEPLYTDVQEQRPN